MGFLASQNSDNPILSSQIAKEMDIPRNFLSKILNRLAQADLIHATRGRRGGVKLARPGNEILLHEVVELFMKINDYKKCFLGFPRCDGGCGLHLRWRIISEQFERMLKDTTIDNVL